MSNTIKLKVLGKGKFGEVVLMRNKTNIDEVYALKQKPFINDFLDRETLFPILVYQLTILVKEKKLCSPDPLVLTSTWLLNVLRKNTEDLQLTFGRLVWFFCLCLLVNALGVLRKSEFIKIT
ncbi:hypothetical protein CRE_27632 [Caenorhabditis remanei]|uniref:Protein kinase domain-containing protein n=1 Tax=Caenorhabditis remanei TaxID=31234 RepID=E3MKL6_CAERE|nr:hypothetical protein CRE_27632 [Caenorhabditis remanei]